MTSLALTATCFFVFYSVFRKPLFVLHNVSSVTEIIRKQMYSLLRSLRDCNSLLVCAMLHSDTLMQSSLLTDGESCYT